MFYEIICAIQFAFLPVPLYIEDPLARMESRTKQAIESSVLEEDVKALLTSLLEKTILLRERLGDFESLPESYRRNLTAISKQFARIPLDQTTEKEVELLSDIDGDFEDKLRYVQSGHVTVEIGRHDSPVYKCAYQSRTKNLITVGLENQIKAWSLTSKLLEWEYSGTDSRISTVTTAKDTDFVVAGFDNGTVALLSAKNGIEVAKIRVHPSARVSDVAVTANAKIGAIGLDSAQVSLWNLEKKEKVHDLNLENWKPRPGALEFSPDGKKLAAITRDGRASIYGVESGKKLFDLGDRERAVDTLKFLPDNRGIVTAGRDGSLVVHDARTGEAIRSDRKDMPYWAADISPNGKWLAAAGGRLRQPGSVDLIRPDDNEDLTIGMPSTVYSLCFSDVNILYFGGSDGVVRSINLDGLSMTGSAATTTANVNVTTWRDGMRDPGHFVWYVARALIDTPSEYQRFDSKSHCGGQFPPGRYWLWAGTDRPNQHKFPLRINNNSTRNVDVNVP